jgi:hypothetical protein
MFAIDGWKYFGCGKAGAKDFAMVFEMVDGRRRGVKVRGIFLVEKEERRS